MRKAGDRGPASGNRGPGTGNREEQDKNQGGETSFVSPRAGGCAVRVRVHPRARRDRIAGVHGDTLKLEVTTAPEGGAANRAVERLLAAALGVPARAVAVVVGATSRSKVVAVDGVAAAEAAALLAAAAARL